MGNGFGTQKFNIYRALVAQDPAVAKALLDMSLGNRSVWQLSDRERERIKQIAGPVLNETEHFKPGTLYDSFVTPCQIK